MSIVKTPIVKDNSSWITGWIQPTTVESIYYTFPVSKTRISNLIKDLVKLNGQLWSIPESPQTLIDSTHKVRFGTSPLTRSINKVSNYELIDGWEDILNVLRKSDASITKNDLTGFNYCTINPLTHLMVKNYEIEEETQTSLSHKIFHINCSPDMESIIDSIVDRNFVKQEGHIFPKILRISV